MLTETVAPPQGEQAESTPAPEAEQTKPAGHEQADAKPQTEEQAVQDGEPREEGKRKRGLGDRALEYRNQARDLARMNERLLGLLEQGRINGELPRVDAPSGPPRREDFDSIESYLEAKTEFQLAEKLKEVEAKAERARHEQAIKQRETTWQQKQAEAAKKYEDFIDVVSADDLAITPIMAEAIKDSDMGPEVAYYLGKNPDQAERIARLNPAAQVREIGKIEARLESKPPKSASKAPPPISPVGSGGGGGEQDMSRMSQAEYEAYRKKWASRF